MVEHVIYLPEADDDIAESYGWYESRDPGLGQESLRCVEVCLLTIQRHPHAFPVAVDEFRHVPVPLRNIVYAIFHCSQDPENGESVSADDPRDYAASFCGL